MIALPKQMSKVTLMLVAFTLALLGAIAVWRHTTSPPAPPLMQVHTRDIWVAALSVAAACLPGVTMRRFGAVAEPRDSHIDAKNLMQESHIDTKNLTQASCIDTKNLMQVSHIDTKNQPQASHIDTEKITTPEVTQCMHERTTRLGTNGTHIIISCKDCKRELFRERK